MFLENVKKFYKRKCIRENVSERVRMSLCLSERVRLSDFLIVFDRDLRECQRVFSKHEKYN